MSRQTYILLTVAFGTICATASVGFGQAVAQTGPTTLVSARNPTTFSSGVSFEDFRADEADLSELSSNLYISVPIGRRVVASMQAGHAVVSAGGSDEVAGFDDVQLTVTGGRRLKSGSILFTVSGNLPSGKRELQLDEFETSVPLSYNFFDFRVPSLGQAPGVSAGAAAALAPTDRIALGLGVSYTLHGGFKPIAGMQDAYKPGNELVLTTGVEIGFSQRTAVSADVTYTIYGDDTIRDVTIFEAGPKVVAALQLTSHFGYNTLKVSARHRTHADSRILSSDVLIRDESLTLPAQTEASVIYGMRVSRPFFIDLSAAVRHFDNSPSFTEKLAVDLGVAPAVRITRTFTIMSRFVYTMGDIDGYEAGLNLGFEF